jgi:hypothetical protein
MRLWIFVTVLALVILLTAAVLLAPYIGLGQDYSFILYRLIGISRGQAFFYLRLFLVLFCITQLLLAHAPQIRNKQHWDYVVSEARLVGLQTTRSLFEGNSPPITRAEWIHATLVCMLFIAVLPLFLSRNLGPLSEQNDLEWYQAFIDYDIDWRTPLFSLAGNLLNHFGVQVPVNANLAPLIRLAHAISPHFQIVTAVVLFYAAFGALFWVVGRVIGLRPVPCAIFAGTIALILNIPFGLETVQIPIGLAVLGILFWIIGKTLGLGPPLRILFVGLIALLVVDSLGQIYVIPPSLFTTMLTLIFWWQETTILSLTAVVLFFLLGQKISLFANLALGFGFAILCYVVLLAFPAGAFFAAPVIGLYCLFFLFTATNKQEFLWKIITGTALTAATIATNIPDFFLNLYSYSWGSYFVELISRWNRTTLLRFTSMAFALSFVNFRIALVILGSVITCCFVGARSSGSLRRVALSVLFVECCILLIGVVNAYSARYPIAMFYSEMIHAAFLVAFFILFLLLCLTLLLIGLKIPAFGSGHTAWIGELAPRPYVPLLWVVSLAAILIYAFFDTAPATSMKYPPQQPESVRILKNEIELRPGEPFRGRVLVLAGMQGKSGNQWPGGPGSISDVLEFQYRTILGNDHYVHLLPFHLSVATDFGHWTSPVTFVFLHKFFGRKDDIIPDKAFFPLRAFNDRVARLIGIRMVVSDAPGLPGGSIVYETKAGHADLRIFRIEHINLGQYSPTRIIRASTASEILATIATLDFDPEHDVVIDDNIPGDLVPATSVSVITHLGPTLSVSAESTGRSLLVLPFEYSHCVRLEASQGTSGQLMAVNLQQIGLLFEKQIKAKIAYWFGPLERPKCRKADRDRADRLRLRDAL